MRQYSGIVYEIRYEPGSWLENEPQPGIKPLPSAWISCPPEAIPAPGQFVQGWSLLDGAAALATALFPAKIDADGFLTAPPAPPGWDPGTPLELRGPIGHGFSLPGTARRLALAAFDQDVARLRPVLEEALRKNLSTALFCTKPQPNIPAEVEIFPIHELSAALHWPDVLMLDISVDDLPKLRKLLGLKPEDHLPCPTQALVATAMPCGGLAECGACFIPGRRNWKQACQDGPVFDLNELQW
jgi:hypothetical protein